MATINPQHVPQADSLRFVRQVVQAVARKGARSAAEVAAALRQPERKVQYAVQAARMLGWLSDDAGGRLAATPASDTLLSLPEDEPRERAYLRELIAKHPLLRRLAPRLLGEAEPDRAALALRIQERTGLAASTALRRAQTLLAWRREIGPARAPQLLLPIPTSPSLTPALIADIQRDNPWWSGQPGRRLPPHRRAFVGLISRRLDNGLAPIIVVRGPRQVGKTTAQLQVIADLVEVGVDPRRILRVQFDELPSLKGLSEPILRIVEWYERTVLGESLNAAAHHDRPTFLFFDEVQNLSDWAVQLKHLVDSSTTQVVVTGSSALRIEAGRDSLAGRITTLEVGTLSLSEIAAIRGLGTLPTLLSDNGLESLGRKDFWHELAAHGRAHAPLRDEALQAFSDRGGYPLVHDRADVGWVDIAPQLNETVIRRVIQHDLRVGERGRKRDEALLEELFRLVCRYAGQSPGPDTFARELQRVLKANVGVQRVRQYLDFLGKTLLVRLVRPLEIRLKKGRGQPKLCLADHGLRASWLQELVPIFPSDLAKSPELGTLAGRIVESVVGSYLLSLGDIPLTHFPERPGEPEVDFVITIGTQRIPIEVKYQRRISHADTEGLRSFIERTVNNAPFGVLVTQSDDVDIADPRICVISLASLLLMR